MTMYDNKRLALSIFWVVAGIALVVLSVMEVLDSSLYAGMGGGLAVVGVFQIVRNLKYRTNVEYREKVDVEVNDERNKYLRMKSWSWAGYITVLVEAIGVVVAMITGNHQLQITLAYSVCLITFSYWVAYMVLSRKY
jgi:hypothetical protein